MMIKYLVRTHDYHIYEIDERNSCYHSFFNVDVYDDMTRLLARETSTFENLTKNHNFFPIKDSQLNEYIKKYKSHKNNG